MKIFNVTRRKVGGITFIKIGRINLSWCVSRPVPRTFSWGEVLDENGRSLALAMVEHDHARRA